ncbi:hypothetical protein AL543_21440 [Vibrio mimicus]|nr:hypothetical protein AL543_21440 [Vibrio mimicus]KAA3494167.1 hypothetical protein Y058_00595 [Vibrio mimicus]
MRKTNVANTATASSRTGITLKRQNAFFYRRIASAVFYPAHPLFMMNHLSVERWMLNLLPLLLQNTTVNRSLLMMENKHGVLCFRSSNRDQKP